MSGFETMMDQEMRAAPAWFQLVVMVNDGSGSMTLPYRDPDPERTSAPNTTKAAAVDWAVRALLRDLKAGRGPQNFHFAFVSFNDTVTDAREPARLLDISADASYDPTAKGIGGTAIHRGLDAARQFVERYMGEAVTRELPASAVVTVMSDGEERDDREATKRAAATICELPNTKLAACLFATQGQPAVGGDLLRDIVSEPDLYAEVYSSAQLRSFFKRSVTATRPSLGPGA